jgi:Bifunctional DNA primase/polymerase, N-terminal
MTQRSQPGTLRDAAIRYANQGIPILPDQLGSHRPNLAAGPPVCTCHRRDCPALPLHAPCPLDRDDAAARTSHVGRWWTANPDAAIATVAGAAFDVIEIHTASPPDAILQWLAGQDLAAGPVLYAGLGRLQLLAAPHSYQTDRYDSATAAILYLAPGSLLLLPPSHLADGQSVTWLRPLGTGAGLPDGTELFWTLVDLPANQQLADPDVYTFPAVSHQRCRTG